MAPLVAALIKFGMSGLAGAVATKGKELVEEKLGVNLDSMLGSESGRIRLKELEMEHEQFLVAAAQASEARELEYFKAEIEDRGGARDRDVKLVQAGVKNYRADVMFVLAVIVICWLVYIVWKDQSINEYVKGIFTLVLGRFLGYLDNIYNFEFGTTRYNRSKDASIENLSKKL